MTNKTTTLREKISELLIKHNLPTRQVAIGELVKLVESEVQEAEKESKKLVEAIHLYNTEPLKALEKARQEAEKSYVQRLIDSDSEHNIYKAVYKKAVQEAVERCVLIHPIDARAMREGSYISRDRDLYDKAIQDLEAKILEIKKDYEQSN